jgi:hypothetical protein
MNNYDEQHIEQNIDHYVNGNNYDTTTRLLFIIMFFFGHILFYYASYSKYQPLTYEDDDENDEILTHESEESVQEEMKQPVHVPYEEKYMVKVRTMKNEYVFTEEELELEKQKLNELTQEENNKKLESTYFLNEKIEELTIKLKEINDEYDEKNDKKQSNKDKSLIKKLHDSIQNEINLNKKQLLELQENPANIDSLKENAQQYIIDEQLKKFKKNYIIEHTPLGNVLMFYNHDKLAFEYYSDLTIPYRYLETVARKYVVTYNYRPLYIDMEEELKEYEKKMEEKEAREKEENDKKNTSETNPTINAKHKDVFAKFKSYNKEAGTGRVNTAPPPKNSIPQNRMNVNLKDTKKDSNGNNEKMLLKERANRYSYQGKFLNFNILQKVDKKVVDKKYALTFADFKKMKNIKT